MDDLEKAKLRFKYNPMELHKLEETLMFCGYEDLLKDDSYNDDYSPDFSFTVKELRQIASALYMLERKSDE